MGNIVMIIRGMNGTPWHGIAESKRILAYIRKKRKNVCQLHGGVTLRGGRKLDKWILIIVGTILCFIDTFIPLSSLISIIGLLMVGTGLKCFWKDGKDE